MVTYEMLAEPSFFVPKRYLNRKLQHATFKWIHAFRQYINQLHESGRLAPGKPLLPGLKTRRGAPLEPARRKDVAQAE